MTIEPVEFILKDGRKAVIRSPKTSDVKGLLDYLLISAGETEYIIRYPEECKSYTAKSEKILIKNANESTSEAVLVCEIDGKIAGNCQISFNRKIKLRHRAGVAICLLKEFWGLGIGSKMFEVLIETAKRYGGILQIELEVAEGNERAIALYEKFGFKKVCVHPKALHLKDGSFKDNYLMIKEL